MKYLKYNLIQKINVGTEEEPIWEETQGSEVRLNYTDKTYDANMAIAKSEAWQGIVDDDPNNDDGLPEPETAQSQAERIADLEEALNMLLTGVTE